MHDPEKSDSGIVATKPTNKAGVPVAELVEPRLGTKGNADQQNTHRTQSRARVAQALERAYGKPQGKGRRNSSLLSSTTSTSTRSGRRTTRSSAKPRPAW